MARFAPILCPVACLHHWRGRLLWFLAAPAAGPARRNRHCGFPALLKARRAVASRLLFRAPLVLYRFGLGGLLGHEFLLLMHAGRRSGRVRETVLKVLRYDARTGESIVASAWGERADWYRNIRALPAVAVRTGRDWYVPEQRALSPEEAFAVFEDWTRRQRRFARLMLGQIGLSLDLPEAERRALVACLPFVGLRPRQAHEHRG
jgi:deazaflavin-dependent oxidoreductase (nitroreductase family)